MTASLLIPGRGDAAQDLTRYVDPFIGTLGSGFVFPGPAAPYGMVQLSPDTEGYFAYTGYMWSDHFIRGFSHVHVESMGVPEGGNLPFMPTVGPVQTNVKRYQSKFSHATEQASAGYYAVTLDSYGVRAELTAGMRVGVHRYTFPPVSGANVLMDVGRQIPGGPTDDVQRTPGKYSAALRFVDDRTVVGTANPNLDGPHRYAVHFAAKFDREFAGHGVWDTRGSAPTAGADSVSGTGAGGYVTFDATSDQDVVIKVGVSFVSQENALLNLESEIPGNDFDFEGIRSSTEAAWNEALHAIVVDGGTVAEKKSFYTALYHSQHHPNVFSDVNGEYLGHDGQVHRIGALDDPMPAGSSYYANFSMWDTYRAEMPLLMLIAPERMKDMMRSLAAIKIQGGRLPRWALMNRYPDFMNGEPSLQVIADAHCRGLVPGDSLGTLYDAMREVALINRRDPSYLQYGYVPADISGTGASSTLEHASGDFALALVADSLGNTSDRDALISMAGNYRNHLDPDTRFMRPRRSDGSWVGDPYLPEMPDGWREGTGWQYTWLASHDVRGLFNRIGAPPRQGDDFVLERLDTFFGLPAQTVPAAWPEVQQKMTLYGIAYVGNQYAPSNEHDLQAPYLYNWTPQTWKTQLLARQYQSLFRAVPDGLPGNDDLGTMSAWYVWSALGFYPMIPGAPIYVIGSPQFKSAEIRLQGGGSFSVNSPGASAAAKFIRGVLLDGVSHSKSWFTHDQLVDGGNISFEMDVIPTEWGRFLTDAPPSMSTNSLADFACTL